MWEDCGNVDALLSTNRILLEGDEPRVETRGDSIVIHPSAVHESAILEGSVVGPYASIGADCRITRSIVTDSIVEADAQIESALLERSLVGVGASIRGRGVTLNVGDVSSVQL
jgi:glucose-1-phosphate thymidylyltransferase